MTNEFGTNETGNTNTAPTISAAQLEANRRNAQKSTGPRTEEGKANARFNARRHGLTGQFYCMSEDDEKAYIAFESSMLHDLQPRGAYETQLTVSITQDQWRLNRSRATEFNLYGQGHDQFADQTDAPTANLQTASTMADTYRTQKSVFGNIALYETRIHRMIAKNRHELNELQAVRKKAEAEALKKAELLLQLADFLDEPISSLAPPVNPETEAEVGLIPTDGLRGDQLLVNSQSEVRLIPSDGLRGDQLLVNGFVFSVADVQKNLELEKRLTLARECAKRGWDGNDPYLQRLLAAA